jgi:hypothetical protein
MSVTDASGPSGDHEGGVSLPAFVAAPRGSILRKQAFNTEDDGGARRATEKGRMALRAKRSQSGLHEESIAGRDWLVWTSRPGRIRPRGTTVDAAPVLRAPPSSSVLKTCFQETHGPPNCAPAHHHGGGKSVKAAPDTRFKTVPPGSIDTVRHNAPPGRSSVSPPLITDPPCHYPAMSLRAAIATRPYPPPPPRLARRSDQYSMRRAISRSNPRSRGW